MRVRCPDLFSIRGNVKPLRAFADCDVSGIPPAAAGSPKRRSAWTTRSRPTGSASKPARTSRPTGFSGTARPARRPTPFAWSARGWTTIARTARRRPSRTPRAAFPRRPPGTRASTWTAWAGAALNEADGVRVDVRGINLLGILGHDYHVRPLLPQAQYPVDFLRSRVIASDDFVGFRREVDFSFGDGQTVRGA